MCLLGYINIVLWRLFISASRLQEASGKMCPRHGLPDASYKKENGGYFYYVTKNETYTHGIFWRHCNGLLCGNFSESKFRYRPLYLFCNRNWEYFRIYLQYILYNRHGDFADWSFFLLKNITSELPR